MKTIVALLGLVMACVVAASLQAAPSQPGAAGRATSGEFSQWAQRQRHPTCVCVINTYTFCMDATKCAKCAGECSW
jgi:hypothetical protein